MAHDVMGKLRESISRYGLVNNLVVRLLGDGFYEVLSGNQRLKVLRDMEFIHAPCVVVELDDAHSRLLAQALNRLQGEDDLGLRAELVKAVLEKIPQEEVLALLVETPSSLQALASLSEETVAEHLAAWQQAQGARLKHLQFQLTPAQLEVVEEAIARVLPRAKYERGESPNTRGTALFLLSKAYLQNEGPDGR
jgi:ParB family chromosome partitioning protein